MCGLCAQTPRPDIPTLYRECRVYWNGASESSLPSFLISKNSFVLDTGPPDWRIPCTRLLSSVVVWTFKIESEKKTQRWFTHEATLHTRRYVRSSRINENRHIYRGIPVRLVAESSLRASFLECNKHTEGAACSMWFSHLPEWPNHTLVPASVRSGCYLELHVLLTGTSRTFCMSELLRRKIAYMCWVYSRALYRLDSQERRTMSVLYFHHYQSRGTMGRTIPLEKQKNGSSSGAFGSRSLIVPLSWKKKKKKLEFCLIDEKPKSAFRWQEQSSAEPFVQLSTAKRKQRLLATWNVSNVFNQCLFVVLMKRDPKKLGVFRAMGEDLTLRCTVNCMVG